LATQQYSNDNLICQSSTRKKHCAWLSPTVTWPCHVIITLTRHVTVIWRDAPWVTQVKVWDIAIPLVLTFYSRQITRMPTLLWSIEPYNSHCNMCGNMTDFAVSCF
jgi:hypothetical protein